MLGVDELEAWLDRLRAVGYLETGDEPALVAPFRRLGREWRLFVVGAEIVASSQYARGGEPERGPTAPPAVLAFARDALRRQRPAACLVLDVAEAWISGDWELRVVELNSINSAGFHGVDPGVIVAALSASPAATEADRSEELLTVSRMAGRAGEPGYGGARRPPGTGPN